MASLQTGTKTHRSLASYMLAETAALPFLSSAEIARRVGVSELSVGRFCRALGFDGLKSLKAALRDDVGESPWLAGDRLDAFREAGQSNGAAGRRKRSLDMQIAALVKLYALAETAEWRAVILRLAHARRVFVAGFQTERGMAALLAHQLHYVRPGVSLLDAGEGHFAEVLLDAPDQAALVMFEARRYARLAQQLAEAANDAGVPVTLVTDVYCEWGRRLGREVLPVSTDAGHFFECTAPMAMLVGLLVDDVCAELGEAVGDRPERVSRLYSNLQGHANVAGDRGRWTARRDPRPAKKQGKTT